MKLSKIFVRCFDQNLKWRLKYLLKERQPKQDIGKVSWNCFDITLSEAEESLLVKRLTSFIRHGNLIMEIIHIILN